MRVPPNRRNGVPPPALLPPYPAPPYKLLPPPGYVPSPGKPKRFPDPKKRKYQPWEVDMTLCIGALCQMGTDYQDQVVVVAFDERVETDVAGANTEMKYVPVSPSWGALLAGPVGQARELLALYREHFAGRKSTESSVLQDLRVPLRRMKERLADTITHHYACMPYQDFMDRGKAVLSEEMHRHIENQIATTYIEAQLILVGCIAGLPKLFVTGGQEVAMVSNFSAIGSGSSIAQSVLYQREQAPYNDVSRALYNVYEAMRLGQNAPGVGPCRVLMVLVPHAETSSFTLGFIGTPTMAVLEENFRTFGPKPVPEIISNLVMTKSKNEKADDSLPAASEGEQKPAE